MKTDQKALTHASLPDAAPGHSPDLQPAFAALEAVLGWLPQTMSGTGDPSPALRLRVLRQMVSLEKLKEALQREAKRRARDLRT